VNPGAVLSALRVLALPGWNPLIDAWYRWGLFVAAALALICLVWVLLGSRSMHNALPWQILAAVGLIFVLPSLIVLLAPQLVSTRMLPAVVPVAYAGLVGALLALVAAVATVMAAGRPQALFCPNCGQRLDPTWDHCPYCAGSQPLPYAEPQPFEAQPYSEPTQPVVEADLQQPFGDRGPAQTIVTTQRPAGPMAWLVITSGTRAGKEFRLDEATGVGRDAALNQINLDDGALSRQHAKIKHEEGEFVLYDLGSTNGTFVNGERIYRQALKNGDKVKLGETIFTFMCIEEKQEGTGQA
jgi:hypothetical protein